MTKEGFDKEGKTIDFDSEANEMLTEILKKQIRDDVVKGLGLNCDEYVNEHR